MRKWHFWLVLVFGLLLSIGMWGLIIWMPTGHDYAFQVMRMQSASRGWANGQILPQVDPEALSGFGYAYNLFYGPIISYFAAAVQFLTAHWAVTINLVLSLLLIASGITMCFAVTKISKKRAIGTMAGIFYMAMPYVLSDYYARMAVGEITALAVAPILFLGLYQLTIKERHATRNLAIAAAIMILSHSLSAAIFALMAAIYVVINIDKIFNLRSIWRMILAVVVAVGLSAFFTLPLIEARLWGADYGIFDTSYVANYFGANAGSVNDHRLYPTTMFLDNDYFSNGAVLGPVAFFGLVGFWLVRKKIEEKAQRRFLTSLWIIAVLFLLATMAIMDWGIFPEVVLQIQFPWRFFEVVVVAFAIIAAYVAGILVKELAVEKQRVLTLVAGILAIMPVTQVFLPNMERHLSDEEGAAWMEITNGSLGWQAEYAPVEMLCSANDGEEKNEPYYCSLGKIEKTIAARGDGPRVLAGKVKISNYEKDGSKINLKVKNDTNQPAEIELPLIYYPGYEAWLDDDELILKISEEFGLMTIVIPARTQGEVKVSYGVSRATQIGVMISFATILSGMFWMVISGIYDYKKRKKDAEVARLMDSVREVIDDDMEMLDLEAFAEKDEQGAQIEHETEPSESQEEAVIQDQVAEEAEAAPAAPAKVVKKSRGRKKSVKAQVDDEAGTGAAGAAESKTTRRTRKTSDDTAKSMAVSSTGTTRTARRASSRTTATKTRDKIEEDMVKTEIPKKSAATKVTKVKAVSRPRKDPE